MKKFYITTVALLASIQISYAQWYTNPTTNDAYNTNSSGKVGIGTSTPAYTLDVNGTGHFVGSIPNTSSSLNSIRGNGNYAGYNLTNSPSSGGWVMVSNFSNGADQLFQLAYDQYQSGKLYTRYSASFGSDWSDWKTIINSDALAGSANYSQNLLDPIPQAIHRSMMMVLKLALLLPPTLSLQ